MSRPVLAVVPDLEVLLERSKPIRPLPPFVRTRALARARAALAAAVAYPAERMMPSARGWVFRGALAVSIVLVAGATGAGASLLIDRRHRVEVPADSSLDPMPPEPTADQARRSIRPQELPAAKAGPPRPAPAVESYSAELALLQQAQLARAKGDHAGALAVVAEHGRRFPNGRLAEEREAFRIRSLAAEGRDEEARRAVVAFGRRFPRSVLLPRLRGVITE